MADAFEEQAGMTAYTRWWLAHPWHVTEDMETPDDCDCEGCEDKRQEKQRRDEPCKT